MTRLLPALAAGLCCTLLGLRRSQETQQRRSRLTRWTSLMDHLALLLKEEAGSLPDVLRTAAREDQPPDQLLRTLASMLQDAPLTEDLPLPPNFPLSPQERDLLLHLLPRLTRGSRDSRVQAMQACADAFRHLSAATCEQDDADAKMWRQLALLGGACLTLWLL